MPDFTRFSLSMTPSFLFFDQNSSTARHTKGYEVYCYTGHTSPVKSLCISPSGRYLATCSDIGERSIRVWFSAMPFYDREPAPLGLRLRWGRSGLVKRLRATAEPSAMNFFLTRQEEREGRESSDESAGEKARST